MQLTEIDVIKGIKTTNKSSGVRARACLRVLQKKAKILTALLLQRRKEIDINKKEALTAKKANS